METEDDWGHPCTLLASDASEPWQIKAMIGHEGIPWWAEFQMNDNPPFATLHRMPGPMALLDGTEDACCCMMGRSTLNAWLCLPALKAAISLRLEQGSLCFDWHGHQVILPTLEGQQVGSALTLWFSRLVSLASPAQAS